MNNLKFNLKRVRGLYNKPVIKNVYRDYAYECLIDTGAAFPVWCVGEKQLKSMYPNCVDSKSVFMLGGFGKGVEIVPVYIIPNFILSDGRNSITFENLAVAVTCRDFSVHMILSYTMFSKMNISIDTFSNRNGFHNVEPNFKVAAKKSRYYIRSVKMSKDTQSAMNLYKKLGNKDVIRNIYIFTQE